MIRTTQAVLVFAILLGLGGLAHAQDIVIVAHPGTSVDTVTKKDLKRVFLKQRSKWSTGEQVTPVDQKMNSEVRAGFCEGFLGKSQHEIDSYWQAQVFSGKSSPPRSLGSDQEVLVFVSSTPGAVGYVSSTSDTSQVKILQVTE